MSSTPSSAQPLAPREPTIINDGTPQTVSTVIISTDGAYNHHDEIGTIGFTIKSNGGEALQEGWQEAPGVNSSMQAEAVAALTAIRIAHDYNPGFVIVNTDCEQLQRYLTETRADKPALELLCEQARRELDGFDHARVRKIRSENNTRADELAARGLRHLRSDIDTDDSVWLPSSRG